MVGHTNSVKSVVFSPDGTRLASCSHDSTVRLWDAHTGGAIGDPMVGHTNWVNSVVFSPDGIRLASCSYDNTVRLWDAHIGGAIGDPMVGHTNWVNSVVFSPDGTRLASCSKDNTVRLGMHTQVVQSEIPWLVTSIRSSPLSSRRMALVSQAALKTRS